LSPPIKIPHHLPPSHFAGKITKSKKYNASPHVVHFSSPVIDVFLAYTLIIVRPRYVVKETGNFMGEKNYEVEIENIPKKIFSLTVRTFTERV
jgi:hypothetical protein